MVWHGKIIDPARIPAKYAAHPYCIHQNDESFVLYTSRNDPRTAYHAANFQMAIQHNHCLQVDFNNKFNPLLYAGIAAHMNLYEGPPRWAVYLPENDLTVWPETSTVRPTLQEFMVCDTDICPHAAIPAGKVLVNIEFEQHATALMLEAEKRCHQVIEKKRSERAFERSGEVEGKLSAEQAAKLALKRKLVMDDYEKRKAAKEAETGNPQGEGPNGSGNNTNMD
ncbi:hypothetical protein K438DRAFT_1774046 [Mycena galopus ATCC 62051]|nr:hypothetical protein K438DRAFT_1774046 [Mycena galopus ATCC 62051]